MPLSPALAEWLVDRGHDAVHAGARGLYRAPDSEILDVAEREARTVVTADLDYPRLLAIARAESPSVILFRDGQWSEADVIRRMAEVLNVLGEAEILGSIVVVDRTSLRRRRLPIGT